MIFRGGILPRANPLLCRKSLTSLTKRCCDASSLMDDMARLASLLFMLLSVQGGEGSVEEASVIGRLTCRYPTRVDATGADSMGGEGDKILHTGTA